MKKILIVDDEENLAKAIRRVLMKGGYNVEITTDPLDAYKLIKKNELENEFDLVISDTMMPGMSGLELKARLDEEGINVPFIGMSAIPDNKTEWEGLGSSFLNKPYKIKELYDVVKEALKE